MPDPAAALRAIAAAWRRRFAGPVVGVTGSVGKTSTKDLLAALLGPTAFATDETVRAFLQVAGSDGLPLTLVDGVTVMTGSYPAREQLLRFAGVDTEVVPVGVTMLGESDESGACCGGTSCC